MEFNLLDAESCLKGATCSHIKTDQNYKLCPIDEDWKKYAHVEELLERFYQAIELFSGVKYLTTNILLPLMWNLEKTENI